MGRSGAEVCQGGPSAQSNASLSCKSLTGSEMAAIGTSAVAGKVYFYQNKKEILVCFCFHRDCRS